MSGRANIAGAGINMAQRVMDCGDAGHILVSRHVAEDLGQLGHWKAQLHDLGECEVKHGVRLGVVNLYRDGAGNPALPKKFQAQKQRSRVRWVAAAVVILLALGAAFFFATRKATPIAATAAPEKSIAVLPMVNSTGDPANEYFSDGMSEEFISSLSRLSELKVIGRTSSFQFKDTKDNSKTIGEKLGVRYLLEGSVRKSAERVRIAVALIQSNDGANVWSETYDREMKDIFAVQSEIAGAVAKHLKVALLGDNGQTAQLAPRATPSNQNIEAYNALLQGNFYENRRTAEDARKAIGYYEEAIRLDPRYALAYARLSIAAVNLGSNLNSSDERRTGSESRKPVPQRRARCVWTRISPRHIWPTALILQHVDFNFTGGRSGIPPCPRARAAESGSDGESRHPDGDARPARRSRRAHAAGDCARPVTNRSAPQPRDLSQRARPLRRGRGRAAQGHRAAAAVQPELPVAGFRCRFCAASPAPRWKWRNRRPIRSGAPTDWRWRTLLTATGPRPTRR